MVYSNVRTSNYMNFNEHDMCYDLRFIVEM